MPKLFVLSGPEVGATHAFDGDVDLGRAPGVSIVLRGPSVSRRHARIQRVGERWFLEDLGSANGTTIGRRGIQREELTDGTLFELGELELRFRLDSAADASPSGATTVLEEGPGSAGGPVGDPASGGERDTGGHGDDELELEGDWETVIPPAGTPWSPALQEPLPPRPAPLDSASDEGVGSEEESPVADSSADVPPAERFDGGAPGVAQGRGRAPKPAARESATDGARVSGSGVRRREGAPAPGAPSEHGASARNRVLQYRQVPDRQGFVSADLSQYPAWVRGLVMLLALALFLAVAYGAFHLTTTLRGGSGGDVSLPRAD